MAVNILLKRSSTASKRPVGASMAFGELNLNYDASTGGLYYKNSAGGVTKVGPCQVSATAPNSSPAGSAGNSQGEFWYDTATSTLKVWDGSAWAETGGAVQGVTATAPITVDNTDPLNPVIGIDAATTTSPGAVQLNDTATSTSTTEALTANQGRLLQEQIDALAVASNLTFAGSIDGSTGFMLTVSAEGTAQGFVVGQPMPAAAPANAEFFTIVAVPGTMTPPGGSPQVVHQGDWWLSNGTSYDFLDVGYNAPYASTSAPGVVQLATNAEVQNGTNTDHAVTPSGLQSKVSDSTSTTSSLFIASSSAVKDAYDAGIQGQTDAAAAQATADAALPKAGGVMTGDITFSDAGEGVIFSDSSKVSAISNSTSTTSSVTAASSTAVKSAYDLADAALPKSGGTMTGDITFSDPGEGVVFSDASKIEAISNSTSTTDSNVAASATAVKSAYDLANTANNTANAALPKAGGTMTGDITFQDAGEGVVFSNASKIHSISDSVSTTDSEVAASATAVKTAYDLADDVYSNGNFGALARPNLDLLVTPTIVPAADQLGVVIDSSSGLMYTVEAFDAGTF